MAIFAKRSGTHKETSNVQAKVNGKWKQGIEMFVKRDGKWREVWRKGDLYLTFTDSYESIDLPFDEIEDIVVIENLVVKVYDGSGNLLTVMNLGTIDSRAISLGIFDDDNVYGDVGFYTYKTSGTLLVQATIDKSTAARKFVVSADTISFYG